MRPVLEMSPISAADFWGRSDNSTINQDLTGDVDQEKCGLFQQKFREISTKLVTVTVHSKWGDGELLKLYPKQRCLQHNKSKKHNKRSGVFPECVGKGSRST